MRYTFYFYDVDGKVRWSRSGVHETRGWDFPEPPSGYEWHTKDGEFVMGPEDACSIARIYNDYRGDAMFLALYQKKKVVVESDDESDDEPNKSVDKLPPSFVDRVRTYGWPEWLFASAFISLMIIVALLMYDTARITYGIVTRGYIAQMAVFFCMFAFIIFSAPYAVQWIMDEYRKHCTIQTILAVGIPGATTRDIVRAACERHKYDCVEVLRELMPPKQ